MSQQKGFYYADVSDIIGQTPKAGVFSQVVSIKENLTKYTKKSVDQAKKARKIQVMFNNISTKKLIHIIDNNMVKGLPITTQDGKLAEEIYGPNVYTIKGKTTNRKVDHIVAPITSIPKQLQIPN